MRNRLCIVVATVLLALACALSVPVALADEHAQGGAGGPDVAAGIQATDHLVEVEQAAALVQAGDEVAPEDMDATLAEIQVDAVQAQAYPLSVSKPDQLRARLHTRLSALDTRIDVRDLHILRTEIDLAALYAEVVNADPDLFYVTTGFTYQYYNKETSPYYEEIAYIKPAAITEHDEAGNVTSIVQPFAFPIDQVEEMRDAYDQALAECLSWVPAEATQPQAAKAVHDWLAAQCAYNHDAAAQGPSEYGWGPWTSYGALVDRSPVCQGYSLAFLAAMNRLGIQASYVTHSIEDVFGTQREHGWNRVEIDGSWYNLDITFDDSNAYASDHFFLRSDDWWTSNLDTEGFHAGWTPAGTPATDTRYDGETSWTAYTGPGGALPEATSLKLALAGSEEPTESVYLACDEAIQLVPVNIEPTDANIALTTWSSSDPQVATVDSTGRVSSGASPGRASLTCSLGQASATVELYVEAGDLSADPVEITLDKTSVGYSGSQQHPTLRAIQHADTGDIMLEEGVDYQLAWSADCTNIGTKQVTVTGIGAFEGTKVLSFRIVENDKSALRAAIDAAPSPASAATSTNGADIDKSQTWVPTKVKQALETALKNARATLADPNRTRAQIQAATDALKKASATYEASKRPGTKAASWKRLWGATALDTMRKIVAESHASAPVAVLATMGGYWDALSASSLAGAHNAPILLTNGKKLSAQTRAELKRLKTKRVFICGGNSAVSIGVETQVKGMGIAVTRVAGANANATACAVYDTLGAARANVCIVATNATFHDALAASPMAYTLRAPIFLCNGKSLDARTRSSIAQGGFKRIIVVGGTAAVSKAVEGTLSRIAPVVRLAGNNAYETSAAIASYEVAQAGFDRSRVAVATGKGYWDALSGASLCGPKRIPLVLADNGKHAALNSFVRSNRTFIKTGYVLGGTAAVSQSTMNAAIKAAS